MPHLVDKEIIEEMHSHWPQQFANTAGNRFRTSTDMQVDSSCFLISSNYFFVLYSYYYSTKCNCSLRFRTSIT